MTRRTRDYLYWGAIHGFEGIGVIPYMHAGQGVVQFNTSL